nr:hypothetical protein orf37 [uncultured bacterium]
MIVRAQRFGRQFRRSPRVALTQSRARCSGSAFREMSATTATLAAPASRTPVARSSVIPPIPTRGILPIFFFHSEMRGMPCGAKAIIRLGFEGAKKLGFVMGRDAPRRVFRQTLPG